MNRLFANMIKGLRGSPKSIFASGLGLLALSLTPQFAQGSELIDDVRAMVSGADRDMAVRLRLTASNAASQRTVTFASLIQARESDGGMRTELTVEGAETDSRYCSVCASGGGVRACDDIAFDLSEAPARDASAFNLPWQEIFGNRCMARNVSRLEDIQGEDDEPVAVFDVTAPNNDGLDYQRLYFSVEEGLPVRIERFDGENNLLAEIAVLRARHTKWGPAIQRFIYGDLINGTETLIEVRSVRYSGD